MQLLSFHIVFELFLNFKNTFEKNKLHILTELEILYHPVYLSIFLHRFIEKKLSTMSTLSIDKYQKSAFFVDFEVFFLNSLFL
jgi:hypothetical protein